MTRLRRYFVAGLLTILPVFLTLFVLWFIFQKVGALLTEPLQTLFGALTGFRLPHFAATLISFGLTLLIVLLVGTIASNVFGRRLLSLLESLLQNVPIARGIYSALKQLMTMLFGRGVSRFGRVVMVPYPTDTSYSLAFVTSERSPHSKKALGEDMVHVFLPTTPNPTSGFFLMYKKHRVKTTDLTVEEALRLILSGGMIPGRSAKADRKR